MVRAPGINMELTPRRALRWCSVLLFCSFYASVGEARVSIREDRLDPYGLVLEAQSVILNKLDDVLYRVKSLESLERKVDVLVNSITPVPKKDNKIEKDAIQNLLLGEEYLRVDLVTPTCLKLISNMKNKLAHELENVLVNFSHVKLQVVPSDSTGNTTSFKVNKNNGNLPVNNAFTNATNRSHPFRTFLSSPNLSNPTNFVSTGDEKFLPQVISDLKIEPLETNLTESEGNLTRLLFSSVDAMIKRQLLFSSAMDKKFNAFLHAMALRQQRFEDRLSKATKLEEFEVKTTLQAMQEEVKDYLSKAETRLASQVELLSPMLVKNAVEPSLTLLNETTHSDNNVQVNKVDHFYNVTPLVDTPQELLEKQSYSFEILKENHSSDLPYVHSLINTSHHDNDSDLELLDDNNRSELIVNDASSGYLLERIYQLFSPGSPHLTTKSVIDSFNNNASVDVDEEGLESSNQIDLYPTYIDLKDQRNCSKPSKDIVPSGGQLLQLKNILKNEVSEGIQELKTYFYTRLYFKGDEILRDIKKSDKLITISTERLLNQVTKSRDLSLSATNAAITSITSSAVASATDAAMHVSRTLKNSLQKMSVKMNEMIAWMDAHTCPGTFQRVGTKCLLFLPGHQASWREACHICRAIGGYLSSDLTREERFLVGGLAHLGDGFWSHVNTSLTRSSDFATKRESCDNIDSGSAMIDNDLEPKYTSQANCTAIMGSKMDDVETDCRIKKNILCESVSSIPILRQTKIEKPANKIKLSRYLDIFV